jgi:acyl-CoA hydrolase
MEAIRVPRLVKTEDMNHHGNLYAGRMAEWFVEACYLCAVQAPALPGAMVCLKIHDLVIKKPCPGGETICLETRIAKAGSSSLTVYGKIVSHAGRRFHADGYVTFVCVDKHGRPTAHRLRLPRAADAEERAIRRRAAALKLKG